MPQVEPEAHPQVQAPDLPAIRAVAAKARDLKQTCADLTERLEQAKEQYNAVIYDELPTMLQLAGMDHLGLPAQGNNPAYDIALKRHITANIASNWEPEKRKAAFAWLRANKHGDLIKTVITIRLGRNTAALVKKVVAAVRKLGCEPEVTEAVHNQTLGAWLREQVDQQKVPPLETIGGHMGFVAELKQRNEN
jgi:hypothetical protein